MSASRRTQPPVHCARFWWPTRSACSACLVPPTDRRRRAGCSTGQCLPLLPDCCETGKTLPQMRQFPSRQHLAAMQPPRHGPCPNCRWLWRACTTHAASPCGRACAHGVLLCTRRSTVRRLLMCLDAAACCGTDLEAGQLLWPSSSTCEPRRSSNVLSWQSSTIAGEAAGLGRGYFDEQHLVSQAQRRLQPVAHLSSLGKAQQCARHHWQS